MDTPLALDLATPEDLEARREAEKRGEPFLLLRDDERRAADRRARRRAPAR